ncbi:MAG: hypothetical protein Q7R33_00805 [Nitrosarchaeum sp.]|nr:hypothetical protein [Nitrosarchaeum sp.]
MIICETTKEFVDHVNDYVVGKSTVKIEGLQIQFSDKHYMGVIIFLQSGESFICILPSHKLLIESCPQVIQLAISQLTSTKN